VALVRYVNHGSLVQGKNLNHGKMPAFFRVGPFGLVSHIFGSRTFLLTLSIIFVKYP